MNVRIVAALVKLDLAIVGQNKGALIPMIVVPLVFMVLLPAAVGLGVPRLAAMPDIPAAQFESMVARLPAGLQAQLAPLDTGHRLRTALHARPHVPGHPTDDCERDCGR